MDEMDGLEVGGWRLNSIWGNFVPKGPEGDEKEAPFQVEQPVHSTRGPEGSHVWRKEG